MGRDTVLKMAGGATLEVASHEDLARLREYLVYGTYWTRATEGVFSGQQAVWMDGEREFMSINRCVR